MLFNKYRFAIVDINLGMGHLTMQLQHHAHLLDGFQHGVNIGQVSNS